MSRSRTAACIVLAASLVLGPLAMALDGCAAMGMCETPCGLSHAVAVAPPALFSLQIVAGALVMTPPFPQRLFSASIEPPPKLPLFSL